MTRNAESNTYAGGFMAFAMRYASRSIWRNRRRTILTIGTVALSVTVTTVTIRYSKALLSIWEQGSIDHGTGHAQIHVEGFLERPDVITARYTFEEGHAIQDMLTKDPAVAAVTRRVNFEGIISSGTKAIYFLGRGVSPDTELQVSPAVFDPKADEGDFLLSKSPDDEITEGIAIGRGLAETLGVSIGDEVSIMANTLSGNVNGLDAIVVGIVEPPLPTLSKRLLYMPLSQVQEGLELDGRYTEIAVRLKPEVKPEEWVKQFEPAARAMGLLLRGWWDVDPVIRKFERIWDSILGVITSLLFLSAAISVLNIVYMMVAERTVEIGTLMAIGAKARDVRTLFMLEAGVMGIFGGIVGSLVGNLIVLGMYIFGVRFQSPFSAGYIIVHPEPSLTVAAVVSLLAIGICILAAFAPARKAARVEPVIAFRGQIT